MSESGATCYHCGLPMPPLADLRVVIGGVARDMCCRGCEAVAQVIVDHGLSDYYRHRTQKLGRAASELPDFVKELALYDAPEVQRAFVREAGEHEKEASLLLEGITCAACVWLNEQHIARLPGVLFVYVNYATRRARVRWDERAIRLSEILREIAAIGYTAHPYDSARLEAVHRKERKSALWRLFVAGFGMMQVMMYAVPVYLADGDMSADIEGLMRWASFALTLPVLLFSAQPFFSGALRNLKNRCLGMDVPVALGIGAAFAASVWSMFAGAGEVYFDSVTMFVFLLLAARYLENVARHKASSTAEELVKIIPAWARRMRGYPQVRECGDVPVCSLAAGEIVLVQPGEIIPVDGKIIEGTTRVEEALLTGESAPIVKRSGDAVTGGTLNSESSIIVEVTGVGENTVLAGIVRLLDRALAEKPQLAELADRAAGFFVFALLLIAAAVAAGWSFVEPARVLAVTVAVLVVSCPCALSLATPAALAAATGSLARRGVLITRGHALESLARATHFVFDKTGTLTDGRLKLIGVIPVSSGSGEQYLALAAALEAQSEHPIARTIRAAVGTSAGLTATDVHITPGGGVEGRIEGRRLRIGTVAFVRELAGEPIPRAFEYVASNVTVVALGNESGWLALFTLGDTLKGDARHTVSELKRLGKAVCLLSGDRAEVVRETAARLGIEVWKGDAKPEDKLEFVHHLAREGAVVAMVGDGVNDAPVLAGAHVSVAARGATQVAQAAADVILLSDNLAPLAEAARHAEKTLKVIRQNLAWAVVYNAVSLPLAAMGYVTPWLAGIGMAGSSLIVVANALRLTRDKNNIVRGAFVGPLPTQAAPARS